MMKTLNIIKAGGNIINDEQALQTFLKDFSQLEGLKVLVHGGGKIATETATKLGIETRMVEGRRITDKPSLDVAVMVYAGLINKNIVAQLQALSCNATGLTGADMNIIPAHKRQHPTTDFGFVGDFDAKDINAPALEMLLSHSITPIFSALTHDGQGHMLNTNADTIAAGMAVALSKLYKVNLIYCFEKNGVLRDVNDDHSVIPHVTETGYQKLVADGAIHDGMLPKLKNAFDALHEGVSSVTIKHAAHLGQDSGTLLTLT